MKHRSNNLSVLRSLATALLILLWVYAALSKLISYGESRSEMLNQVFPATIAEVLAWAVPLTELLVAGLLIYPKTIRTGLFASLFLLIQFTLYIGVVMTGIMGRIPCSCGGVLEEMSWGEHLAFNLFFLALTITALFPERDQCSAYKPGNVKIPHWKGAAMGKDQ